MGWGRELFENATDGKAVLRPFEGLKQVSGEKCTNCSGKRLEKH